MAGPGEVNRPFGIDVDGVGTFDVAAGLLPRTQEISPARSSILPPAAPGAASLSRAGLDRGHRGVHHFFDPPRIGWT